MHRVVGATHESPEKASHFGRGGLRSKTERAGRDRPPGRSEKKQHIKRQLCFTDNKADRRGSEAAER